MRCKLQLSVLSRWCARTHIHAENSVNVSPVAFAPEDAASARAALNARAQIKAEQQR